jgi:hypothetical protein
MPHIGKILSPTSPDPSPRAVEDCLGAGGIFFGSLKLFLCGVGAQYLLRNAPKRVKASSYCSYLYEEVTLIV